MLDLKYEELQLLLFFFSNLYQTYTENEVSSVCYFICCSKNSAVLLKNSFTDSRFLYWWLITIITDAVKSIILVQYEVKRCYWYLTIVSIGFTDWADSLGGFSTRRAVAAAEAIRGWGPWCPHLGSRAGGGQLSGPGTLCRSLAPPAPRTTQGNPPADAPWTVDKVNKYIRYFILCKVDCKLLTLFDSACSLVQQCHHAGKSTTISGGVDPPEPCTALALLPFYATLYFYFSTFFCTF